MPSILLLPSHLFNYVYYLPNQLIKLLLCDLPVPVFIQCLHHIVDFFESWLLHVKSHGYSSQKLSKLVFLEVAGVVDVEVFECGC